MSQAMSSVRDSPIVKTRKEEGVGARGWVDRGRWGSSRGLHLSDASASGAFPASSWALLQPLHPCSPPSIFSPLSPPSPPSRKSGRILFLESPYASLCFQILKQGLYVAEAVERALRARPSGDVAFSRVRNTSRYTSTTFVSTNIKSCSH